MKAAFFDHVGQPLRIDTLRDPVPAPDEVVLQIAACGRRWGPPGLLCPGRGWVMKSRG